MNLSLTIPGWSRSTTTTAATRATATRAATAAGWGRITAATLRRISTIVWVVTRRCIWWKYCPQGITQLAAIAVIIWSYRSPVRTAGFSCRIRIIIAVSTTICTKICHSRRTIFRIGCSNYNNIIVHRVRVIIWVVIVAIVKTVTVWIVRNIVVEIPPSRVVNSQSYLAILNVISIIRVISFLIPCFRLTCFAKSPYRWVVHIIRSLARFIYGRTTGKWNYRQC